MFLIYKPHGLPGLLYKGHREFCRWFFEELPKTLDEREGSHLTSEELVKIVSQLYE